MNISERDAARITALEAQHLQEREEMHAIWGELEDEKAQLAAELTESERQLKNLARERERLKKRAKPVKVDALTIRHTRAALGIFKNITIHSDTADTVATHFSNPDFLYQEIFKIDQGEKIRARKLHGVSGNWFSLLNKHINTGSNDMGRLYFREHEGQKLLVVHRKKDDNEQRRFIENLANPRFMQDRPFDE